MKKIVFSAALVGLSLFCANVFAKQSVDESMSVSPTSYIHIEHINGSAKILGWDKNEVSVTGELGDKTKEFIFKKRGDDVRIEVEAESVNWGGWKDWDKDDGDNLTIYVPRTSTISYESVNATVFARDISADARLEVVNGKVEVTDMLGRVRVESVNGNVEFSGLSDDVGIETVNGSITGDHSGNSELILESVNGNIRLTSKSENVRIETVNGDVDLRLALVKQLEMTTVNGDLEVEMELHEHGEVDASTVGGRVELTFSNNVSARFEIEGHAGGKFVNRITDDKMQKAKYGPRRWLNFTAGSGSAQVDVSTVNGRVELRTK